MVTESFACPGTICAGPWRERPRYVSSTISPSAMPCCRAVSGPIHTVLSQVSVVIGFGTSCSQALLANVPSQTVRSGRMLISIPCPAFGAAAGVGAFAAGAPAAGFAAVFGTTPSWTQVCQFESKSAPAPERADQYSFTMLYGELTG